MDIIEIIEKKRDKQVLSQDEIIYFVEGYTNDLIKDYQVSALLMAIVLNGMNDEESTYLTQAMLNSGEIIDLSSIMGIKCDKHSTGGVGDKVTLVLAPLLASAGAKISKMSGRGLGHTGGTLDKLEAIPNYNIALTIPEFINQVNDIGIAIIGQTSNLVPADKKLYALRDVTGTVQSIPLIASSIMSKKLACGADAILLDVKVGEGAFMKNESEADALATLMVKIGRELNKDVRAIITDMNQPLGYAIGNTLEVIEAIETLQNKGPKDLETICLQLGSTMLVQAKLCQNGATAYEILKENLMNGKAFDKFVELVAAQKGDTSYLFDVNKFPKAKNKLAVMSVKSGYIKEIHALTIGNLALKLGAGRHTKKDRIDYEAGIVFTKKIGDYVVKDEVIAYLHSNQEITPEMANALQKAITYTNDNLNEIRLVKKIIR